MVRMDPRQSANRRKVIAFDTGEPTCAETSKRGGDNDNATMMIMIMIMIMMMMMMIMMMIMLYGVTGTAHHCTE